MKAAALTSGEGSSYRAARRQLPGPAAAGGAPGAPSRPGPELRPTTRCLPPALNPSQPRRPRAGRLARPAQAVPGSSGRAASPRPTPQPPPAPWGLPGGPVRKTCLDMVGNRRPRSTLSPTRRGPAGGNAAPPPRSAPVPAARPGPAPPPPSARQEAAGKRRGALLPPPLLIAAPREVPVPRPCRGSARHPDMAALAALHRSGRRAIWIGRSRKRAGGGSWGEPGLSRGNPRGGVCRRAGVFLPRGRELLGPEGSGGGRRGTGPSRPVAASEVRPRGVLLPWYFPEDGRYLRLGEKEKKQFPKRGSAFSLSCQLDPF